MRQLNRFTVILLAAFVVSGCSSFWSWVPFYDGPTPDVDEPTPLVSFDEEADVKRLWKKGIGDGLGRKYLRLTPAIVADRVYVADAYGHIEARNRFDGEQIWEASIGQPDGNWIAFWDRRDPSFVTGGVGVADGVVMVGTTTGDVVALDVGDGTEVWRAKVSSEVLAPPVADGDTVVVQTGDGKLFALEQDTGETRWIYDTQVPILTLRGTATPTIDRGVVYAGFATGMIAAVDTSSGAPIWEQRIMLPQGRSELQRMVDVDGTPMLDQNFIYAASYQGRLKAMRRRDGAVLWDIETSSFLDLAAGYGQIYVVTEDDVVMAINQADASIAWEQEALKNRALSSPLAFGNYVVVGDDEGYLHVIAQSDGRLIARRKVGGKGLRSPLVHQDGTVYVLANNGDLSAMEIRREG